LLLAAVVVVAMAIRITTIALLVIPVVPVVVTLSKIQTRPVQRELKPPMQQHMLAELNTVTPEELSSLHRRQVPVVVVLAVSVETLPRSELRV
jgi:UDP-N-acetylmuramyl pentapeptide phosphotransferase/UDP-N-acetylglucosamine-1-phosphate transferase